MTLANMREKGVQELALVAASSFDAFVGDAGVSWRQAMSWRIAPCHQAAGVIRQTFPPPVTSMSKWEALR